jgi:hypothetical protein
MTRSQLRSLDKAHDQAHAGNLPTLISTELLADAIHEVWRVTSRTDGTTTYTVDLLHTRDGIETLCDCPAATAGRCCWHRGAARLAHTDSIKSVNLAGVRYRCKVAAVVPARRLPALSDLADLNLSNRPASR